MSRNYVCTEVPYGRIYRSLRAVEKIQPLCRPISIDDVCGQGQNFSPSGATR